MRTKNRQTLHRVALISLLLSATYAAPSRALVATAQATLDWNSLLSSLTVETLRGTPVLTWVPETFQALHGYAQEAPPGTDDSDGVVSGPDWIAGESLGATANANASATIDAAGHMTAAASSQLGAGTALYAQAASTARREGHFEISGGDARVTFQGPSFVALSIDGDTVVDGEAAHGLAIAFASLYLSHVGASSADSNYLNLDVGVPPSSGDANELLLVTLDFTEGSVGYFEAMTNTWVALDVRPVPVPAAAWMFGSALVAAVGVARRRRLS